ncbi:MAG: 3-phosphoshikimate 1-carboxyvinyltransferase, partial [Chloroflexi bacterium RBG_13_52_14]
MRIRITPSPLAGVVQAPSSKSYTHRAIIIASLAAGESIIEAPLISDDVLYTIEACRFLGADIEQTADTLKVRGTGGEIRAVSDKRQIYAGNSGSTIRMVAGVAALSQTKVILDGDARLRLRPVGDLLSALNSWGIQAQSLANNGCPPIEIQGGSLTGGEVSVYGQESSQHVSSLLMIAPYARNTVRIKVIDGLLSKPYVDMTLGIMRDFGVNVVNHDYKDFLVESGQTYHGRRYRVEGDYSSAAYLLAAGAIGGRPVSVCNLDASSLQGDRYLLTILSEMGCLVEYQKEQVGISRHSDIKGITIDMGNYPDIVQTVAIISAYARGRTKITNIGHLKFKETNRIRDTATELEKMGIRSEATVDTITVYGGRPKGAEIDSHHD